MEYKFKEIIKKGSPNKLRDVNICIERASKNTYEEIGLKFNLTRTRINQIYRVQMAYLCKQLDNIPFLHSVRDPAYYNRSDALEILLQYKKFLEQELNK